MTIAEKFADQYSRADWNDEDVMSEFWTEIRAAALITAAVPGRRSHEPKIHIFEDDSWFDPKKNEFGSSTQTLIDEGQAGVTTE